MGSFGSQWQRLLAGGLAVLACVLAPSFTSAADAGQGLASPPGATARPAAGAAADLVFRDAYGAYLNGDCSHAAPLFEKALGLGTTLPDYALFYLARCRIRVDDRSSAASLWQQLARDYPHSVYASAATLDAAQAELTLGHPEEAARLAQQLAASSAAGEAAQGARMVLARASASLGDFREAYARAELLRQTAPHGPYDAQARDLVYALVRAHPEIAPEAASPAYRIPEAQLLIRERAGALALRQAKQALAGVRSPQSRAALVYLEARAYRLLHNGARERLALLEYLNLAPIGPEASAALDRLGHLYWQLDDTAQARAMFSRLVRRFPRSQLAPEALFSTARTYEDDHSLELARRTYLRLIARYVTSEFAERARFRAPWTLYLAGDYAGAAALFSTGLAKSTRARDRDRERMLYWYARSLERSGRRTVALALMRQLAASIDTNYYPALAESRTGGPLPITPAALVEDPAPSVPQLQGVESFHLLRALALKQIGLQALEVGELRRLEPASDRIESLRSFLVHEFQAAGAWYDAIRAAIRMAARGEIDHWQAEHIRYPRAFWDLVKPAAERTQLDPYLVLAVIRQESLFNPEARSVSDARGLMQLIPATAVREAAAGFGPFDGPQSLYQPEINIALGTAHLRHLLETFSGDRVRAIAAYNAGSAPVRHWDAQFAGEEDDEWVENIGYQETRDYVKLVLGNLREYRLLYGRTKAAGQAHAAEHPSSG